MDSNGVWHVTHGRVWLTPVVVTVCGVGQVDHPRVVRRTLVDSSCSKLGRFVVVLWVHRCQWYRWGDHTSNVFAEFHWRSHEELEELYNETVLGLHFFLCTVPPFLIFCFCFLVLVYVLEGYDRLLSNRTNRTFFRSKKSIEDSILSFFFSWSCYIWEFLICINVILWLISNVETSIHQTKRICIKEGHSLQFFLFLFCLRF